MNSQRLLSTSIGLFFTLAIPALSYAQQPPATPAAPNTASSEYRVFSSLSSPTQATAEVYVGDPFFATMTQNVPELRKKINLSIKETDTINALRQVGKAIDIDVEVDKDLTSERRVQLRGKDIEVQDALNSLTTLSGLRWRYEKKNGKAQIHISRGPQGAYSYSTLKPFDAKQYTAQAQSMWNSRIASTLTGYSFFGNSALPSTRVKIDVRDADVRDTLKSLLTQANLPYALEDDVPTGEKHSFTFENVPITMALDIVTTSIGVGWRAETTATTSGTAAASGTAQSLATMPTIVRIGKKYTGSRNGAFRLYNTITAPAPVPAPPATPAPPPVTQP